MQMGLISDCENCFKTTNLYEVLNLSNSASEKELKKAYYKSSLKVHPDRVDASEKENATLKFQILGKVYSVLSDKDKRAVYDETGEVDDEIIDEEKDWNQYWRLFFKKISITDIKEFEEKYKGSEDELKDLQQAYNDGEGDMNYILENVLCATVEDEDRFNKIISKWIQEKEVKKFAKFCKNSKTDKEARKRKAENEAKEAEELKKELGLGDSEESLKQLIQSRGRNREAEMDSFFDNLAAKYSKPNKKTKNKAKK
ncbi:UNVERIFIED_CONTAM: hypothetical protein RMT77_000383 [Armadillidium vulgare]